jgi:hypothetical protein
MMKLSVRRRNGPAAALVAGLAALASAAGCGTTAGANRDATFPAVLEVAGRVDAAPLRFGAADLLALPRRTFEAREPGGAEAKFEGLALAPFLFEEVAMEPDADVLVVHGRDGYAVAVPLGAIRQHRPVLADRVDGTPLAQLRPAASPLLLAWPNVEQPGLAYEPRARSWWVEGVQKVEVAAWSAGYGRALRVPTGAPDAARAGAEEFARTCMQCHRLRGEGGSRGPDLSRALATLAGWDGFAAAVRAHEGRPGAEDAAGLPRSAVRDVAAFLHAVAVSDPAPVEEPAEPEELEPPPEEKPGGPGSGAPPLPGAPRPPPP